MTVHTDSLGISAEPLADEALLNEHLARRSKGKPQAPTASSEARAWLACERRRRNLQTMLDAAIKEQERARQALMERWSMDGLATEKVDRDTVYLKRKVYPKVRSKEQLTEALKKEGLTELLTADEKAFATYVTEQDEAGQALPGSIAALIADQFERFDVALRARGSDGSSKAE